MFFVANSTASAPEISRIAYSIRLSNDGLTRVLVCFLCALVLWRAWRFKISPFLYPGQPEEFPYWIPFLGHGRAFFLDSNNLLSRARRYFGNTEDPFAVTAFGVTFYIVTQAKHSAEVYRNTENLSFETFVQALMRNNGADENVIHNVYSDLPTNKPGFPNPLGESLGVLAQRMHEHQLHPGKNLVALQKQVQAWINRHLNFSDLITHYNVVTRSAKSFEVPLYHWCSETLIQLGQDVYFGHTLSQIDPELPSVFLIFDELIWKMLYQYPGFLSADMNTPRLRVIASIKKYFQVPQSERIGDSAWLINTMEDEMRAIGVDDDHLAIVVFHLYLAINTNTRRTVFWVLSYLVHNPDLLATYRVETAAAFGADGTLVDPFLIQDAERCPMVEAIWHETLRMAGWAASVRLIMADTVIGGKYMRKGARVMVPHRLLHFDENVFGESPNEFRPQRWMQKLADDGSGTNSLARSSSWRPFGGGKTMCSGRFLARFTVTSFVATILHKFDVQLVGNPPFPRVDEGRPVLGTMSPRETDDFRVKITLRE